MWSFDGDYKKKPEQRLSGRSRIIERNELLNKLKTDRDHRESQRLREASALKIQCWVRGFLSRQASKKLLRIKCDALLAEARRHGLSELGAKKIIAIFLRTFSPREDAQRLTNLCQLFVCDQKSLSSWVCGSTFDWTFMLPRVARMAVVCLSDIASAGISIAPALRFLEVVSCHSSVILAKLELDLQSNYLTHMFTFLMSNGYYKHLVTLLLARVPEVEEPSEKAPTALSESILQLIIEPLSYSCISADQQLMSLVVKELCLEILTKGMQSQVSNFVIPLLSVKIHQHALGSVVVDNVSRNCQTLLTFCPAPSVLYSVLCLVQCKSEFPAERSLCNYLQVVSELFGESSKYLPLGEDDLDGDDSEGEEEMDCKEPPNPLVVKISQECLRMLNESQHVCWLLQHVEKYLSPNVLLHLSQLTHQLSITPSFVIHQCTLSYSIVARRHLLRHLWLVLSSLSQNLSSENQSPLVIHSFGDTIHGTSLLQVLSRGTPLTPSERDAIVPLLTTFCSTLTAVLSTLHDSEFLENEDQDFLVHASENVTNRVQLFPFTINELVKMSATLRDVCIGLVDLAHPDARTSTMTDAAYKRMWAHCFQNFSISEPNLHLRVRIHLMNAIGLDEAGIDGGGLFREFLSELLKTAFDPTRGFFLLTRENTLYPNPASHLIAENHQDHYYFIGRMLGKALYENLLVEVPLAGFFLSKLLGRSSFSVDVHHLDSMDPELCRNLLYLKTYAGDVQDLGLDFTILNSELGQNKVEELIPNGSNVVVTNTNRIEYIYRMADYKLNRQIAKQCQAFRNGLFEVVNCDWLQMFDWNELQMLTSGASMPINVTDLMENTKYGGSYSRDHPTICAFWQVVSEFTEKERKHLLKFVTSCSRPPLLGFKDLQPPFFIQPSGGEDRLPTASTCMNLLKLPEYKNEATLKEKLLYAINSGSGFELS